MGRSVEKNWVERGAPPEPVMCQVLAAFLGMNPEEPPRELETDARAIRGMAEANASSVQIVSYLKDVERRFGRDSAPPIPRRTVAVSLWHIAKLGEIRDQLLLLQARTRTRETQPLSEWLAERILRGDPVDQHDEPPRVGVGCIVIDRDRFLLVKSRGGYWSTPGGNLEFGETPEACAIRETHEETGVHVTNVRFVAITNDIVNDTGKHYVTIWMRGDPVDTRTAVVDVDEIADIGWFGRDALPAPLFSYFENLLEGRSLPTPVEF